MEALSSVNRVINKSINEISSVTDISKLNATEENAIANINSVKIKNIEVINSSKTRQIFDMSPHEQKGRADFIENSL